MLRLIAIFVAVAGGALLTAPTRAQETNACLPFPATKLEAFETNTDTVIIRGHRPDRHGVGA